MVDENDQVEDHDQAPADPEAPQRPPRRRRAARRPAGPPALTHPEPGDEPASGEPASGEPESEPSAATAGAGAPEESALEAAVEPEPVVEAEPDAEDHNAAAEEDSAVQADEVAEPEAGEPQADEPEADEPEADEPEADEPTRADAPTAEPETSAPESDEASADVTTAQTGEAPTPHSDTEGESEAQAPETQPRARRSRRATRGVVTAAFSSEPHEAPAEATRPADRPAPVLALFQAPDLTASRARDEEASANAGASTDGAQPDAESISRDLGGDQGAAARRSRRATRAAGAPIHLEQADQPTDDSAPAETSEARDEAADAEDDDQPRRRRRRGGRRRKRPGQGADDMESQSDEGEGGAADDAAEGEDLSSSGRSTSEETPNDAGSDAETSTDDDEDSGGGKRRRRRRRRAGVSEEMEDLSADDPPNTVVKVREARRGSDEVTGVRGSTRMEAKKQRRRDGREAGRRRAPILTEAEFLARRESVNRVMCVRHHGDRTQIAVLEDGILVEHYVNRAESSSMVGNVYLGKVQNVLPSMEAAFVDIGRGRNAVLYAGEVNWDAAGMEGQPKRIELALKSGDPVLVQVTKDPIGHKGARLTSQISLPGRFLVYVPEGSMTGISRKLPDTERARLKGILKDVVPEGAGVIVRTAAEGASEDQLTADVQRLTGEWTDIQRKTKSTTPPTLLYGEPDLAIKVVRDIFNEDFTSLLVQGDDTSSTLRDYIGRVAPDLLGRVEQWTETEDLYSAHRIDEQLAKALDRKVWLPSGGSLVIDRTEAMTVVDVNTGKFTGQGGNLEETVTRNNLEAAEEIVRQLRLRDVGGIIVIDFIDMVLESNRDLVLRRLVECLGRDRTKHQVAEVTSLGLVQMTRKRIGQGLLEVFSTTCEACGGRGHIVHSEPVGSAGTEDAGRGRDRNNRRGQRPAPQVHLGGKQTGKTPPPPKFDEYGHIDHSDEHDAHLLTDAELTGLTQPESAADEPQHAVRQAEPETTELMSSEDVTEPEPTELEPAELESAELESAESGLADPEAAAIESEGEPADVEAAPEGAEPVAADGASEETEEFETDDVSDPSRLEQPELDEPADQPEWESVPAAEQIEWVPREPVGSAPDLPEPDGNDSVEALSAPLDDSPADESGAPGQDQAVPDGNDSGEAQAEPTDQVPETDSAEPGHDEPEREQGVVDDSQPDHGRDDPDPSELPDHAAAPQVV